MNHALACQRKRCVYAIAQRKAQPGFQRGCQLTLCVECAGDARWMRLGRFLKQRKRCKATEGSVELIAWMRVFPERTRDFGAPFARLQSERIQRDALRVERDLHLRA